MDISKQIQLKRNYAVIGFLSLLVFTFYLAFPNGPFGVSNIFIEIGIVLGLFMFGFVFVFLSIGKDLKITTMIKEKAGTCLETEDYYFFMLYYHKTYGQKPKGTILKNLSDKAKIDLNPSEFERFTQQMHAKKPMDKNSIFVLILLLLIFILILTLLVKHFISEFWGSGDSYDWYINSLLFINYFIISISSLSVYKKLNTELEQMIEKE